MTKQESLTFDFGGGLFLIDLPQPSPGFRRFISSWFFQDAAGRRVVTDPGPAGTIPLLLRELENLTENVDLVLLTHIHLDHAGGLAEFCARYPGVQVLAHPRAFRHLLEPRKLWDASVRTLGDIALMYGEPAPLPSTVPLLEQDPAGVIEVFPTPGHAPHHISLRVPSGGRTLFFVGEAAGMTLPLEGEGDSADHTRRPETGADLWLRPTTPPRFDADAARHSLQLLASVLRGDELLCYAHWGASENPRERVEQAREQLEQWFRLIAPMRDRSPEEIVDCLLTQDPLLRKSGALPRDLLERERRFMANSVRGMLES
ncbi:MAG: MBL fold metallo-hydrolase [Fretibacterium sp.]|nr:MBL fold metallo-hydrolase [Fretibacterium sp.]